MPKQHRQTETRNLPCCRQPESVHHTVSVTEFHTYINHRLTPLLRIAESCAREIEDDGAESLRLWQRPLLGQLLSEASQMEELLDSFGARRNDIWFVLREYMAGIKLFSDTAYKLLHLSKSADRYRLPGNGADFQADSEATAQYVCGRLFCILTNVRDYSRDELRLKCPADVPPLDSFVENLPTGLLPATRRVRRVQSAPDAAVQVATTFLQRAAAGDVLKLQQKPGDAPLTAVVPDQINEEMLSRIENTFHNMQTHYDTHIADTETEFVDPDLLSLRGHVSVVFHLLETAVSFIHFYERHMARKVAVLPKAFKCPVDPEKLLDHAFTYSIRYARCYLEGARSICRGILQRYSEVAEIEVPIPPYRGFHVRPSTLIAKIVQHYGCEVTMELMGDTYDAAKPLELFRANEQINAVKRRRLAEKLDTIPRQRLVCIDDVKNEVRRVVLELAEENELVIYQHPLPLDELKTHEGELLGQYLSDQISRLLARGTIDIEADISVTFRGDKRVLADIQCLSDNGYGEDRFGNNIPLPDQLSYLHRD
ncbi:MAG: HPr family phosphocarrier protein [Verrucomicrobiota bacterium]